MIFSHNLSVSSVGTNYVAENINMFDLLSPPQEPESESDEALSDPPPQKMKESIKSVFDSGNHKSLRKDW